MRLSRRRFLKIGLVAAPVAGAASYVRFGRYPEAAAFDGGLANLSPVAGAILAAIVDTMVPGADAREYVRRIDAYLTGTEPADLADLHWLLRGIEHATLVFGGHVRRFTALDREARADVLASWKTSRIGQCRLGLRTLVALVYLAHYRDRATFAPIGYPGPVVPGYEGPPASRDRYDALAAPAGREPGFAP